MAFENSHRSKTDNSSSSVSVGVSVPSITGSVVRNSALGVSDSSSPDLVSSASALLQNVKQGVESEEERGKRAGSGGGKRDKAAIFVDANKHLMRKGILELGSNKMSDQCCGILHVSQLSTGSHPADSCRPNCVTCGSVGGDNSEIQTGVLVAGAGGNMRMLGNNDSLGRCGQAAFPDSRYSNAPDNIRTEHPGKKGNRHTASESSEGAESTVAKDTAFCDYGTTDMPPSMPVSSDSTDEFVVDKSGQNSTPFSTLNTPITTELPPLGASIPFHNNLFSMQSPCPIEDAQPYCIPKNMSTHGLSLSKSPNPYKTMTCHGDFEDVEYHEEANQGRCIASQIECMQEEKIQRKRSQSQPVIASVDAHLEVSHNPKDYFQVSDELSRENSHFTLSEALLSVVEQYKANNTEAIQEATRGEGEPGDYSETVDVSNLYTCVTPRSWGSASSLATDDSLDGFSVREVPKISLLELIQSSGNIHSAESTAQRFLQFVATQYCCADPEDMTSTHTVLTLPMDFLTSLKQDEDLQKSVTTSTLPTRGSKDWAPPRAQIIFHIKHPSRNIMKQLASQSYRCTGCGMRQDPAQARSFRFCNYTGKYFCQKCHTNATSVIPAYIMDHWSFKKYYVSNFAHDLLERIHYEPLFNVQNVNPQVYSAVPILANARDLRMQLIAVKKYLKTCRQAQSLTATFDGYVPWTTDVHTYSVDDFLELKLKLRYLKCLLSDSIKHVKSCPLCRGKGFVCEFCSDPEIIFPFDLKKVSVCQNCQCCFHKYCFGNQPCPRCIRMRQRERTRRMHCEEEEQKEQSVDLQM